MYFFLNIVPVCVLAKGKLDSTVEHSLLMNLFIVFVMSSLFHNFIPRQSETNYFTTSFEDEQQQTTRYESRSEPREGAMTQECLRHTHRHNKLKNKITKSWNKIQI